MPSTNSSSMAERIAGRRSGFPEAHHDLGRVLGETGRTEDAIAEYRRAIEERGGVYPRAHYGLGKALARLGRCAAGQLPAV